VKTIFGSKHLGSNFQKFFKLLPHAIRIKKLIKKNKIDTVLSFLSRANYVNILSKNLDASHKCLISERNSTSIIYNSKSLMGRINRLLIGKLYPKSDGIIAISNGIKDDLVKNFNISTQKIEVIYNPIDLVDVQKKSNENIIHEWLENQSIQTVITVGRLDKQKNHSLLLQAFKKVGKILPETRLLILGEGPERKSLSSLISELGIDNKVQMPGIKNNPFKYLSRSDVFVLSSISEGFGNVILEAMACGCPVISTDCPSGPGEIITDGENGILVPVEDSSALCHAILNVLQNITLSKKLSKNALKRVNDFNLEKIVNQYHKFIINDR
jgi:glycosyltransferase involved in cell wall biosynthesis